MNQSAPSHLDVVYGEYKDLTQVREFVRGVQGARCSGTLYIGYPVLSIDDGKIEFDAVLVSPTKGIVVFDLYTTGGNITGNSGITSASVDRQEQLYAALFNRLNSFRELRRGRKLVVEISTITINPLSAVLKQEDAYNEISIESLNKFIDQIPESHLSQDQEQHLNAAIQRISNLKPQKKRDNITRPDSKGAIVKKIEEQIANLDLWQKRGSIEYVNGPQRIRGLAGSGKTVVIALKAAYLHVKRPDWNIAITFNSRALYQQFESLLTRFVYSQINDEPDWSKLHIMHSWGDSSKQGIYSLAALKVGTQYRDFTSASRLWGYTTAFGGACKEVLDTLNNRDLNLFDMILIDEAQDLPVPFFRLIYRMVNSPRRIIWAYDDLQNLGDYKMPSAKDLFGLDDAGKPFVELKNEPNFPQEDIVLPRCYRTPPKSLVVAHGLGFGIYHEPIVQMFPDPDIWQRLGYKRMTGTLDFGKKVELVRDPESIPEFFDRLFNTEDAITFRKFPTIVEQYAWISQEIKRLIEQEDLLCSDFLIVIPNTYKSKSIAASMLVALQKQGLSGRIPGVNSSRDALFAEDMIAVTHIYRAKGNEAPVVFVVDADYCNLGKDIRQKRNILFTAITRSRAWTYVCGTGEAFDGIVSEYEKVKKDKYALAFSYPEREALQPISVTAEDSDSYFSDSFEKVRDVLSEVRDVPWEQIPLDVQEMIRAINPNES